MVPGQIWSTTLVSRFGVSELTLVGDRGLLKSAPIEALNGESFHYTADYGDYQAADREAYQGRRATDGSVRREAVRGLCGRRRALHTVPQPGPSLEIYREPSGQIRESPQNSRKEKYLLP